MNDAADSKTPHPEHPEDPAPASTRGPQERVLDVRRAPSFRAFIILGTVLGLILAGLSTAFGPVDQAYTPGAVFGLLAVIFGTVGAALGALLALLLDRRSRRRAYRLRAQRID